MTAESYFHVAMVVPALEPALEELTRVAGFTWRPTFDMTLPVYDPSRGDLEVPLRCAYSLEAPFLEVIEATPGTPWVLQEGSNLHHIGFYSESVSTDSLELTRLGCPLELCGRNGAGESPNVFAYHHLLGIRVELVDRAAQAILNA